MGRTLFDKIWDEHLVHDFGGGWALLHIDRHMLHDLSGPPALQALAQRGLRVRNPELVFATPDHAVSSLPGRDGHTFPVGGRLYDALKAQTQDAGIRFFDLGAQGQGIVHVMGPELGLVLPGVTLICGDSHTCTNGALGALAFGIGESECTHALATQVLRQQRPKQMRVRFEGKPGFGVAPKDLILALIGRLGAAAAAGCVVEYAGAAIRAMPIEGRLTICNLTVELGAKSGWWRPTTRPPPISKAAALRRAAQTSTHARRHWRTLFSDSDAAFDREVEIDAASVAPTVTWGTSPEHAVAIDGVIPDPAQASDRNAQNAREAALAYMGLEPGRPSPASRSNGCSSAPAPTPGFPICGKLPPSPATATSRRASTPGSCRDRRR